MDSNLEEMITEFMMDEHHRNPIREAIMDFIRSPEENYFLEKALRNIKAVRTAIEAHFQKCAEE